MKTLLTILLLFVAGITFGQRATTQKIVLQDASEVSTNVTNFDGNLSSSDTDVQKALKTIDEMSGGGINITTQTLTETSGAVIFDYLNGANDSTTIDETTVITMSNVPDGGEGNFYIVQGDAGDDNITFVHAGLVVKWRNDDTDLTDYSGALDIISYKRGLNTLYVTLGSNYITQ